MSVSDQLLSLLASPDFFIRSPAAETCPKAPPSGPRTLPRAPSAPRQRGREPPSLGARALQRAAAAGNRSSTFPKRLASLGAAASHRVASPRVRLWVSPRRGLRPRAQRRFAGASPGAARLGTAPKAGSGSSEQGAGAGPDRDAAPPLSARGAGPGGAASGQSAARPGSWRSLPGSLGAQRGGNPGSAADSPSRRLQAPSPIAAPAPSAAGCRRPLESSPS